MHLVIYMYKTSMWFEASYKQQTEVLDFVLNSDHKNGPDAQREQ